MGPFPSLAKFDDDRMQLMPGPGFAPEDRMPKPVPAGSSRRLRRPPICPFCEVQRSHAHRPIEMAGGVGDLGPVSRMA